MREEQFAYLIKFSEKDLSGAAVTNEGGQRSKRTSPSRNERISPPDLNVNNESLEGDVTDGGKTVQNYLGDGD